MNTIRQLICQYVEDRDSLSSDELQRLTAALDEQPQLAADLKTQLILDELLDQRHAVDRGDFPAQLRQRLRDEQTGMAGGIESSHELLAYHPKPDAATPQSGLSRKSGQRRTRRIAASLAAVATVLMAAVGLTLWYLPSDGQALAVVDAVAGSATFVRDGVAQPLTPQVGLRIGDRLVLAENSSVMVSYHDHTALTIESQSVVVFQAHAETNAKRVFLERGKLTADVAKQPPGRPMTFCTLLADATVVGTQLSLAARGKTAWLDVTEGSVELTRKQDQQTVVVAARQSGIVTAKTLVVVPSAWPSNRDGLAFLFQPRGKAALARDRATGDLRQFELKPRGKAAFNNTGGLQLTGGAFLAEAANDDLLAACRQMNELTIEATIRSKKLNQTGPARIITFSAHSHAVNFTLGQSADRLILRLQTHTLGKGEPAHEVELCRIPDTEQHHVAVCYRSGELVCYWDGEQISKNDKITGDFRNWKDQHLLFGDEWQGQRDWAGTLEGVAIYNRSLTATEVERNALQYSRMRDGTGK